MTHNTWRRGRDRAKGCRYAAPPGRENRVLKCTGGKATPNVRKSENKCEPRDMLTWLTGDPLPE